MIDLTQNGYAHDDVIERLKNSRTIDFKFELLDREERKIKDLEHVTGNIRFDSTQEVMGTASFRIMECQEIGSGAVDLRIRPVFMLSVPNGWLKYPLGVYIMTSPERSQDGSAIYQDVECYDYSTILREDKITSRLLIPAGESYVRQVRNIINAVGIKKIDIETSELLAPKDVEFEIGENKLSIVNSLLTAINYEPLHFDSRGYAVSRRYIEPVNRPTNHEYQADRKSIIKTGTKQSLDVYNVPNIFVRYTNDPDGPELKSTYVNDKSSSAVSTVTRGRNVVDIASVDDVADQDTLDALVRRAAIEKSQTYDILQLQTALMPHHGYRDCIFIGENGLKIGNKYIEYAWSMDLEIGGTMTHTLKRAVRL